MGEQVWAEVVTIGSELVLGQLVDTNASYIARCLAEVGIGLAYHTTVGDDPDRMAEVLRSALDRCQVVIVTGGIGPTEDDLTREVAARIMDKPLILHNDLVEHIESLFKRLGYKMPPNNLRQAYIPEGATVINNPRGTAPAFRCERNDRVLICLPGVPFETEPLLREEVLPFLQQKYSPGGQVWINRVIKVTGLGESSVDAQIKDLIKSSKNPTIGLQASPGEIKIRLTARGDDPSQAQGLLDKGEADIRERLGSLVFGTGEETLVGNTVRLLEDKNLTLAVGETMTRGVVAAELGRRLPQNLYKGALVLPETIPPKSFCDRLLEDFKADLALAVVGFPEEDQFRVEIQVKTAAGQDGERTLTLGGPERLILERAATIAMFTLFSFLRTYD